MPEDFTLAPIYPPASPEDEPDAVLVRFGDRPHQVLARPVAESILRYFAEHDRRKFAQALGAAMLPEDAGPASATPQPTPEPAASAPETRRRFGRD